MLGKLLPTFYSYRSDGSGDKYMAWRRMVWKILVEDFFSKYIKRSDSLLDLPCGFGEFINIIKCKERIAADLNKDLKRYIDPKVKFISCTSVKIPLKKEAVDKIFCSNFFEHIRHEEILATIKEYRRVLKNKGQVLILQPNIRFLQKDYWRFFDHVTAIDDRGLEDAFVIQGFKLVYKIERFFPFTVKTKLPKSPILVKLYLRFPLIWRFFGTQSFLIFEKTSNKDFTASSNIHP